MLQSCPVIHMGLPIPPTWLSSLRGKYFSHCIYTQGTERIKRASQDKPSILSKYVAVDNVINGKRVRESCLEEVVYTKGQATK